MHLISPALKVLLYGKRAVAGQIVTALIAGSALFAAAGDQGGDDLSGHGLLSVFDGEAWVFIKILPGLRNASIFRANFPVRGRMA